MHSKAASPRASFWHGFALGVLLFALLSIPGCTNSSFTEVDSVYGDYLIGRHAENLGDMETARAHFTDVLQKADDSRLLKHLFLLHLASGDFNDARQLANDILEENAERQSAARRNAVRQNPVQHGRAPRRGETREDAEKQGAANEGASVNMARIFLASMALQEGEEQSALAGFASLSGNLEKQWVAPIASAWILWEQGKKREAREALQVSGQNAPTRAYRLFHEALLLDLLGDSEAAEENYRDAIERMENARVFGLLPRLVEGYGNFLERQGRSEEALQLYQRHLRPQYFAYGSWQRYADALEKDGVPAPLAGNGAQGCSELFHGLAVLLSERRDDDGLALVYLRLALLLRPDFIQAQLSLGEQYERRGFEETALEVYRAIPPTSPHAINAGVHIAHILEEGDEADAALEQLQLLRREAPDSRIAAMALAEFYNGQERHDEAIAIYSALLAPLDAPASEDWNLFFGRAVAYERSGDWARSEEDLYLALDLSGEHPLVLNYLGYMWADRGERLQLALEMLRKAVEARPQSGFIVDSLGWVHYRLGEFDKATFYLERAVELEPEDPIINDHLGDSLWQSGRKLEARFQWQRALQLEPEAEMIAVIEDKFLHGLPVEANN